MRNIYTKFIVVYLCMLASITAIAQTGYILTGTSNRKVNNGLGAIYAFDVATPWLVNEICYADTTETYGVVGTLAGDVYYAYMETENEIGAISTTFCSLNMTSGNKTIINNVHDLTYAIDMCYEETTKNIYLLKSEYVVTDEETLEGQYMLQLSTVNPNTGEMTIVATLPKEAEEYNIAGITSDGNGGLYMVGIGEYAPKSGENDMYRFWYKQVNLYRYDFATNTLSVVFAEESTAKIRMTSDFVTSSLGLYENKLYITLQSHLVVLDIDTKVATLVTSAGSGEAGVDDAKLFLGEAVGICFAKSTADATPIAEGDDEVVDLRKVKIVETYGDHMGERKGQMTHRKVSLYDGGNRLQREATYGLTYATAIEESKWEIEYFSTYRYNELGLLEKTYSEKYGLYDGVDLGFIDNRDTICYEYDEAGRLLKEEFQSAGYSMLYEYNEEGKLVKECKQLPDYYDTYEGDFYNIYEITYSHWNDFGQPDSVRSIGVYSDGKYYGVFTYDEKGRKVKAETWNTDDDTQRAIETWTHYSEEDNKGDTIQIYWIHEWFYGFDQGEKRIVYTYDEGNTNRTKQQQQSLTNGTWINETTYTITEIAELVAETAAKLEVLPLDGINACELTLTVPEVGVTGTMAFDVYRHGILLARLQASDAIDGKLTYIDADVKNGTYDYYVQTVLINELQDTEETANISNVVSYTHYTFLPAVTDIEGVSVRKENDRWYITIKWNAPEGMEGLKFERYNVMLANMKAADNATTDGQETTWEVEAGVKGVVELYIQTVYAYGKSNSEMVTIDVETSGIDNIHADVLVVTNDEVCLNRQGNFAVYNMQGVLIHEAIGTTNVALTEMPTGIYLVKVETDGKVLSVKVRK